MKLNKALALILATALIFSVIVSAEGLFNDDLIASFKPSNSETFTGFAFKSFFSSWSKPSTFSPAKIFVCTDPDHSKVSSNKYQPSNDVYTKTGVTGVSLDGRVGLTFDYCAEAGGAEVSGKSDYLGEEACDENNRVHAYYYKCQNGCLNGACIYSSDLIRCYDSDGGKNYAIKGQVTEKRPGDDISYMIDDLCVTPAKEGDIGCYTRGDNIYPGCYFPQYNRNGKPGDNDCKGSNCYLAEGYCSSENKEKITVVKCLECKNGVCNKVVSKEICNGIDDDYDSDLCANGGHCYTGYCKTTQGTYNPIKTPNTLQQQKSSWITSLFRR